MKFSFISKVIAFVTLWCIPMTSCTNIPGRGLPSSINESLQKTQSSTVSDTKTPPMTTAEPSPAGSASAPVDSTIYWPTNGWRSCSPEEQGMDSKKLLEAHKIIQKRSDLHSFVVFRNGYKVFEQYYDGFGKNDLNNIKSCTKSITSILTGIAIKEKFISGVDEKIESYFPEYYKKYTEPDKKNITIRHLLTMSSGLDIDDAVIWDFLCSKDWVDFTLRTNMAYKPGQNFRYSSPTAHLLSAVVSRASKMNTLEFAKKYLFKPLGISKVKWDSDPQGYNDGSGNIYLTPQDMAKIGYLYLNKGVWEGKQIVPAEWVEESTKVQITDWNRNRDYGYLWWLLNMGGYDLYFAAGYGGQFIFNIPKLNTMIILTADWDAQAKDSIHFDIVEKYVIPSIQKTAER